MMCIKLYYDLNHIKIIDFKNELFNDFYQIQICATGPCNKYHQYKINQA